MKRQSREQTKRRTNYLKRHTTKKVMRRPLKLSAEELALHHSFEAPRNTRRLELLQNALLLDIICRIGYLKKLPNIDESLYRAGIDALESDTYLIQWMCEPVPSLGGKRPIEVAETEEGRREIRKALHRISHGVS